MTFGHLTFHIDFLTFKDAPLIFYIGAPDLECMGADMDLSGQFLDILFGDEKIRVVLESDQGRYFVPKDKADIGGFTIESFAEDSGDLVVNPPHQSHIQRIVKTLMRNI